jgi:RNA polymerase sigma-70 factor (ECF subfamily)
MGSARDIFGRSRIGHAGRKSPFHGQTANSLRPRAHSMRVAMIKVASIDRSDKELLESWRGGDPTAGTELFDRYFFAVRRFFRNRVSICVDDLLQKTFLRCVESSTRIDEGDSFRAYLFTIARRVLYAHYGEDADAANLEAVPSMVDPGTSPSHLVARREEQRVLLRALRSLALDLQIAIELHYWEGLTSRELATVLGVPEGTVKTRLHRARKLLRERIDALDEEPELLESTLDNLDHWARSLRDVAEHDAGPGALRAPRRRRE